MICYCSYCGQRNRLQNEIKHKTVATASSEVHHRSDQSDDESETITSILNPRTTQHLIKKLLSAHRFRPFQILLKGARICSVIDPKQTSFTGLNFHCIRSFERDSSVSFVSVAQCSMDEVVDILVDNESMMVENKAQCKRCRNLLADGSDLIECLCHACREQPRQAPEVLYENIRTIGSPGAEDWGRTPRDLRALGGSAIYEDEDEFE